MHQSYFRPNYIFNNDAYFFRFSRTKIPFEVGVIQRRRAAVSVSTFRDDVKRSV